MADLTLQQRFGDSVSFDESTKVLSIDLNDLSSIIVNGQDLGLDVSNMTEANANEYASKVLWSLLNKSQSNQPENNTDETVQIYIQNQGKRTVVRNQVSQFGFVLGVTAYKNDTVGTQLDADELGG